MPRDIQTVVEEQIASWRSEALRPDELSAEQVCANVVTISQPVAADAGEIATRIGELLDVPVYDREVIEHIALNSGARLETMQSLNARVQRRIEEHLSQVFNERNFEASEEVRDLARTMLALREHGPCVLTGLGCVHLVPRDHALAVSITAPEPLRARRLAVSQGLELTDALRRVRRGDAEREARHLRWFGASSQDPLAYDLTLDASWFDVEGCAIIITEAFYRKFKG